MSDTIKEVPAALKVSFRAKAGCSYITKINRQRSVAVSFGQLKRGKRIQPGWTIVLRHKGHETRIALSAPAMDALVRLVQRIRAIDAIRCKIGTVAASATVECEWRFVDPPKDSPHVD